MLIKLYNKSLVPFRMYYIYNGKKIYKKKINIKENEEVEIRFDELQNINKFFLSSYKFLYSLGIADSNSDSANLVVNKDVFVVKYKPISNDEIINFEINSDFDLICNTSCEIERSERTNNNPRISCIKAVILLVILLLFFVGLTFLCFWIANHPF